MRNYLKAHGGDDYHTIILLFECHFFYITDYSKCYNDKDCVTNEYLISQDNEQWKSYLIKFQQWNYKVSLMLSICFSH